MADSGSVLFNFQRRGEIYVKGNASTEEEVAFLLSIQICQSVPEQWPMYCIVGFSSRKG